MKIKEEHYKLILSMMVEVQHLMKEHCAGLCKSYYSNKIKDLNRRIMWDWFWAGMKKEQEQNPNFTYHTFDYLDDNNLETAIKKVTKESGIMDELILTVKNNSPIIST